MSSTSQTQTQTQTQNGTSSGADLTGVHPSAVGPSPNMPAATKTQAPTEESTDKHKDDIEKDPTYPEQKHAGKVGLGPNYHRGADLGDKITGFKETLKGKVTHNPDLATKGHDRMTGEAQRKEREEDDHHDPFATPGEKTTQTKGDSEATDAPQSTTSVPSTNGAASTPQESA